MTTPLLALTWVTTTLGTALLLSGAPWFRRTGLVDRLRPYSRAAARTARPRGGSSVRQVVLPGLEHWSARLSATLGVVDDLATRLALADRQVDPGTFRLRQATRAMVSCLAAGAVVSVAGFPPLLAVATVTGLPALVVLAEERRLTAAIERRRARRRAELPVVAEQMGLLLSAGFSLPGALARLARRSDGVISQDLRGVTRRIGQGVGTSDALGEWAERSGLDEIGRLVAVLRLHDDAGDLGALISEEARSIRASAHRDLLETIERRSQLVWVPVTVATLVPGLIFLAVPFMSAMSQVTGG